MRLTSRADAVDLHLSDGRIDGILPAGAPVPAGVRKIDGRGLTACPGFIDLHIHGALGFDFMDATEEAYRKIGEYHASGGTTSYMPTTATESPEAIIEKVRLALHEVGMDAEASAPYLLTFPYRDFSEYACRLAGDTP